MVKHYKKSNKTKKNNSRTKSRTNSRTKSRTNSKSKLLKGGDGSGGRVALPPAYFNNSPSGLDGYFSSGSSQLDIGKNFAHSQGTIWNSGNMAGPNLYPTQIGGGCCGCNKQRKRKNKSSKSKKMKSKKSTKSKSSRK